MLSDTFTHLKTVCKLSHDHKIWRSVPCSVTFFLFRTCFATPD